MSEETNTGSMGKFIVIEGIDGAGKGTQIKKLMKRLMTNNIKCYATREPTDSPIGSLIHQIMTGRISADNRAIACLFAADRVDHLVNSIDGIHQKINAGITVISDRYYFSSYAYHGVDIDIDWVININSISAEILRPTLTVFLDIPVETALERIEKERFHTELFENRERLIEVKNKYFEAFEKTKNVENVAIVDADTDADTVEARIWDALSGLVASGNWR